MCILLCVTILLIQKYFAFNFLFKSFKALPVQYSRLHTVRNTAELYTNLHFSARIIVCLCTHHPTSDEQVMCHGHCSQQYSTLSTVPLVNDTNGTDTGTVMAFLHQWDGSSIYFRNLYCSRKINTFSWSQDCSV